MGKTTVGTSHRGGPRATRLRPAGRPRRTRGDLRQRLGADSARWRDTGGVENASGVVAPRASPGPALQPASSPPVRSARVRPRVRAPAPRSPHRLGDQPAGGARAYRKSEISPGRGALRPASSPGIAHAGRVHPRTRPAPVSDARDGDPVGSETRGGYLSRAEESVSIRLRGVVGRFSGLL